LIIALWRRFQRSRKRTRSGPTVSARIWFASSSRIVNRMKACPFRFGVPSFKSTLRRAPELLARLRTPEGGTSATQYDCGNASRRVRFVRDQIKEIEEARLQRLKQDSKEGTHAMVRMLARVVAVGIETADMLVHEVVSRGMRDRRAVLPQHRAAEVALVQRVE